MGFFKPLPKPLSGHAIYIASFPFYDYYVLGFSLLLRPKPRLLFSLSLDLLFRHLIFSIVPAKGHPETW